MFKCTKIKNIDKSVCTAEQKIAYNFANRYLYIGRKMLAQDVPEFVKNEWYFDIEQQVKIDIKNNKKLSKYNIDAIIIAFRQGFIKYCTYPFIALDYKDIGQIFCVPYDIY